MKTVFSSNQELCHVWASQSQHDGKAGHVRFCGPVLYSYAASIARIVDNNVVLLSTRKWSVTTSAHQGLARSAVSHMKRFHVYSVDPDHDVNIADYVERIKDTHNRYFRARTNKTWIYESNHRLHAEMVEYANLFKVYYPSDIGQYVLTDSGPGAEIQKERYTAKQKAKRDADKAARQAAQALIAGTENDWINGKTDKTSIYHGGKRFLFSCIRLRLVGGNEIQSSQRASVPIKEARILYKAIKAGKPVHGHKIGYYTVISCNGSLKIGCHDIPMAEINRLAAVLGW